MFAQEEREAFYDKLLLASVLPYPEGLSELLGNNSSGDRTRFNWILERAVTNKDARILGFLLSSGLGTSDALNDENQTALHLAVSHGYLEIVDSLFEGCCNNKANRGDAHGLTHFHVACIAGNLRMVRYFLRIGVDPCTPERNDSLTPLHFAVAYGRVDVVELLLRNGADPNAVDRRERTPLHFICQPRTVARASRRKFDCEGCEEIGITKFLIDAGSEVDARDYSGDTPLGLVFRDDYPESMDSPCDAEKKRRVLAEFRDIQKQKVRLLIQSNADVRIANHDDETALHLVLGDLKKSRRFGFLNDVAHTEVTELLVKRGARVDARNRRGETPLEIAISAMSLETVKLLLEYESDLESLRFEDACFSCCANNVLPCLEATENLIRIVEIIVSRGFQLSWKDNLVVLKFLVPLNERVDCSKSKDEDAARKLKNILEFGTPEAIRRVLNDFPTNLNDTSLSEQYSRKRVIRQIRQYLNVVKIGNFYLDPDTRSYLEANLSSLQKCLLPVLSDESLLPNVVGLENELQLMKASTKLRDTLRQNPYKSRSRDYVSILESPDFSNQFSLCSGLIKGHFARGLVRRYVSRSARDCLSSLASVRLPELCCEMICEYLSNDCLLYVCAAAAMDET